MQFWEFLKEECLLKCPYFMKSLISWKTSRFVPENTNENLSQLKYRLPVLKKLERWL